MRSLQYGHKGKYYSDDLAENLTSGGIPLRFSADTGAHRPLQASCRKLEVIQPPPITSAPS
jgi:hypothetical protein